MSTLNVGMLILTVLTAAVGAWSIHWARGDAECWRCRSGRILFVLNLLAVGATGLVAAFTRAAGLPPLGLVAGLLIVGMLWEGPAASARRPSSTASLPPDGQAS